MLLKVIAVEKLLQMPGAYARNFAKPSDTSKIKSLLCSRRIWRKEITCNLVLFNLGKWALLRAVGAQLSARFYMDFSSTWW